MTPFQDVTVLLIYTSRKFEESQKSERKKIVAKILQEEQLMRSRKSKQPPPLKPSATDKMLSLRREAEKLLSYLNPASTSVGDVTSPIVRVS